MNVCFIAIDVEMSSPIRASDNTESATGASVPDDVLFDNKEVSDLDLGNEAQPLTLSLNSTYGAHISANIRLKIFNDEYIEVSSL